MSRGKAMRRAVMATERSQLQAAVDEAWEVTASQAARDAERPVWEQRFAARICQVAGWAPEEALPYAAGCFDARPEDDDTTPEDAADIEISYWENS